MLRWRLLAAEGLLTPLAALLLLDAYCNGGAPQPQPEPEPEPQPQPEPPPGGGDVTDAIVIDSNNAKNDAAKGFISTSNNWVSSAASTETYETGYWYASTQAVTDPATFWFFAAEAGQYTQCSQKTMHYFNRYGLLNRKAKGSHLK